MSRAFVAPSDTLVDTDDVIDLLDRLVGFGVDLLAAEAAGPCVGCFRTAAPVSVPDRGGARRCHRRGALLADR